MGNIDDNKLSNIGHVSNMSNDKCYGEKYSWVRGMESNGVGKGSVLHTMDRKGKTRMAFET